MKLQFSTISLALGALFVAVALPANADVILDGGTDRSICPDPTFNACYIGVDGARNATASGGSSFSFVGLGVYASDISGVAFPPFVVGADAVGALTVGAGSLLAITGDGSQGINSSVLVGNSNGSVGTLNVKDGGFVGTPLVYVGQADNVRHSTGTMTISNGGVVQATLDASDTGPLPGAAGVNIGRGLGSVGTTTVTGAGSTLLASGSSISVGRSGTGTLAVLDGGTVATAASVYGSAFTTTGVSHITVDGTGSALFAGGNLLIGVASTGTGFNQAPDIASTNHGTSTLTVAHGGTVSAASVIVGAGGTVQGDGTIAADLAVFGGTVKPGNSPGTLHVNGNFLMDGGTYVVELASTTDVDLIDISGAASLSNATILFSFIDGFAPTAGFAFQYLHAASVTTSNLTFAYEGLAPGFTFITGEANGSLVVLATSDGVPLAVPEPGSWALLLVGALAIVTLRRRATRPALVRIAR